MVIITNLGQRQKALWNILCFWALYFLKKKKKKKKNLGIVFPKKKKKKKKDFLKILLDSVDERMYLTKADLMAKSRGISNYTDR